MIFFLRCATCGLLQIAFCCKRIACIPKFLNLAPFQAITSYGFPMFSGSTGLSSTYCNTRSMILNWSTGAMTERLWSQMICWQSEQRSWRSLVALVREVPHLPYIWQKNLSRLEDVFLGGGFKYFLFSPLFGEDEPNLTSIFFKGVGSTTN